MLIKEILITCAHSVISIIKLRYSSFNSINLYYQIWVYIVILLQNLRALFIILLISTLANHHVIYIVCNKNQLYTISNIFFYAYLKNYDFRRIMLIES